MRTTASLRHRLSQVALISLGVVGLLGSPMAVRAQQITDPSPSQAATNVDPGSPISASFRPVNGVTVRPETIRVFLDGQDVTAESIVTRDFFSYAPATPLASGTHQVLLQFTNTQGQTRRVTWSFSASAPVKTVIESVAHNAANRPLAAGEILLVTVNGTPSSKVTIYLVQDGKRVQTLTAQEVSPGSYVVKALIAAKDTTREGILVARLQNANQIRFATADQPVQLVQGATSGIQQLSSQDVGDTPNATPTPGGGGGFTQNSLQPQITNYRDGDRVAGNSFALQGLTLPGASVKVSVTAETTLGGFITTQQTVLNQTIQANGQGAFSVTVRPPIAASGSVYRITVSASQAGQTSPTVTLQLVQQ